MIKDISLYYRFDYDPISIYKIRNAELRNKNITIDYRGYGGDSVWLELLHSMTFNFRNVMIQCSQNIDRINFRGIILTYTDDFLNKDFIETDFNKIIEIISTSNNY